VEVAALAPSLLSIALCLITEHDMPTLFLGHRATTVVFFGVSCFCAGASIVRAAPQSGLTASVSNIMTSVGDRRVRAEAAQHGIVEDLAYSTGVAAVEVDAYGISPLGVLSVGPFIFTKWQMACCQAARWRPSANRDQGSPENAQHVIFVWPAT
jgi:hypothetical protein